MRYICFFFYFFAANFNFLLRYSCYKAGSDDGKKALNMVIKTLEFMEKGGIHDHVGQVRNIFDNKRQCDSGKLA